MTDHELQTLGILALGSSLLLALGLQLVSRLIAKDPTLRLWVWGALANAAAYVLFAARGRVPELFSLVLGDTLLVLGASWLYLGNRRFQGLDDEAPWTWYLTGLTTLVIGYFTYATPSRPARVVMVSLACTAPLLASAWVLVRTGDSRDRVVRGFVALTFGMMALFMFLRAAGTWRMAPPDPEFMTALNPLHAYSLVFGLTLNVVLGICLPLLLAGRMKARLLENEERYRTLYHKTPAVLHSIDTQGNLLNVSDQWVATLGYSRGEVIGRKSSDFLTAESRQFAAQAVLPAFFERGLCVDVPYQFVTRDGRILDFLLSAVAERDAENHFVRSLAVMTDVTVRNRTEAALAQSESRFRGAFEFAAHGMALVSPQGRFLKVNSALCQLVGYSESELLQTDFQSLTHPDDLAADLAFVRDLLDAKISSFHMEKRYFHKSGRLIWIMLSVSIVREKDGVPLHTVSQILDITAAKGASQRLQTLLDTASDGIHVLDENGRLVEFSLSFARMLGYGVDEMAQLGVLDWDVHYPRAQLLGQIRSHMHTSLSLETRHRRKDGSVIDVEINAKGIDLDGRPHLYASSRDVSERKLNQRRLEQLLIEQKAMLENELIGIAKVKDRSILWANPALERMLGYDVGELGGTPTRANYPSTQAYHELGNAAYAELALGRIFRSQIEHLRKDGSSLWVDISGSLLEPGSGASLWCFVDVSERRRQEQRVAQSEQRMELALAGADLGMWDVNVSNGRVTHNARLLTMLGYEADDLEPNAEVFASLLHADDLIQFRADVQSALKDDGPAFNGEYRYQHKSGHWVWVHSRGKVVERDAQGRVLRMAGTNQDVSERKHSEVEIHRLAFHDALTQLPNRRLFNDRLHQALARALREQGRLALLFIDLDRFKPVNDEHGHEVGDRLLQTVAQRIQACLRATDTAARLGGDEFAVLLGDIQASDDALGVAEKIRLALEQPLIAAGALALHVSSSTGVAIFPDHGTSAQELLRLGDDAMYRAKKAGGNTVELASQAAPPAGSHAVGSAGNSIVRLTLEAAFYCGNETIDQEHRELYRLANVLLLSAMASRDQPAPFKAAFDVLLAHVVEHFAHEEQILHQAGYVHCGEHQQLHRAIVEHALLLRRQADDDGAAVGALVENFVTDVVLRHMLHEAHKFVELFSKSAGALEAWPGVEAAKTSTPKRGMA